MAEIMWRRQSAIEKDISRKLEHSTAQAANDVAMIARSLCPWDTGRLATTIRVEKSKFKDGGYLVMAGDSEAYYAPFVELGTPGQAPSPVPAKPFLRPALRAVKNRIARHFKNKI